MLQLPPLKGNAKRMHDIPDKACQLEITLKFSEGTRMPVRGHAVLRYQDPAAQSR